MIFKPTCEQLGIKRLFKCVYLCNNQNDNRCSPTTEFTKKDAKKRDRMSSKGDGFEGKLLKLKK